MSQTHKRTIPVAAAGALAQCLRVKFDGSFNFVAAVAADAISLGTLRDAAFAAGDVREIILYDPGETQTMVANGAIDKGVTVYAAAAGKIASTGTVAVGLSLEAAAADGDWIEVKPDSPVTASGSYATLTGTETLTNKTLTTPVIGAATGTSLAATAGITSSGATGAGIGYATGAGGAVSQATDRTTGVTLNKLAGKITTQATSLAAQTSVAFTVTNSTVALGDVIVLSIQSGPTGTKTIATVTTVAAGSFQINLFNTDASTADTGAAIINFAVLKSVAA